VDLPGHVETFITAISLHSAIYVRYECTLDAFSSYLTFIHFITQPKRVSNA
jgi:hypothetical protein